MNIAFNDVRSWQRAMGKWTGRVILTLLAAGIGWAELADAEPVEASEYTVHIRTDKWAIMPDSGSSPAPVIDAELDEPIWDEAAEISGFTTAYTNEPAENSPVYKLALGADHLYIGGYVESEEGQSLAFVQLVLSLPQQEDRLYMARIPVSASDRMNAFDVGVGAAEPVYLSDVSTAVYEGLEQFVLEAAIPLSSLGSPELADEDELRLNVIHAYNINTRPMISWVPVRQAIYHDTKDKVRLQASIADQNRLGSVFIGRPGEPYAEAWTAANAQLAYVGFQAKHLSFQQPASGSFTYRVRWQSPQQAWQELSVTSQSAEDGRVTIALEHPAPLPFGLYRLELVAEAAADSMNRYYAQLVFDREDLIAAGNAAYVAPEEPGEPTEVELAPASTQVTRTMNLIPDKVGFRFTGLPEMPELHPDSLYALSTDGQTLVSRKTQTVYPNAMYPETGSLTAVNGKGETVEYSYYEDEDGKRYFFTAHLAYLQRSKAITDTEAIAATDPLGAARLLYRFAQNYEDAVPVTDYIWHNYPIDREAGPPYSYYGGVWARWAPGELTGLTPLLRAFRTVKSTNAFELLSTETGVDVEQMLIDRMIIPSIEQLRSYPRTLFNENHTNWRGLIAAGYALRQPDYIHEAVEWMRDYIRTEFMSDGFYREVTLSYHQTVMSGLGLAADALQGYSDPPGYVSPRTGTRFDDLDLYEEFPILDKARQLRETLTYPNGRSFPIGDTWANEGVQQADPQASSLLMPAAGIARLADGTGEEQLQLHLSFTPNYGHHHLDPLNLTLYAHGQELLPDLGYTYTRYEYFASSTIGHNTVVVDSGNMTTAGDAVHGGKVERFVTGDGGFQAVRASQMNAYPGLTEYSREPWFIPFADSAGGGSVQDAGDGYVLDLFRVAGGGRHEYTLQGDANRDAFFRTTLPLERVGDYLLPPGTEVYPAASYQESGSAEGHYPGYIYVNDVWEADTGGEIFRLELNTLEDGAEAAGMSIIHMPDEGESQLFLGRSPSIRPTRLNGKTMDTNDEADLYDSPKLVLRREGSSLTSRFVTVLEPYAAGQGPRIEFAERLPLDGAPEGAIAVRVVYGATTDFILSNPHHPEQEITIGDIRMKGEMGLIRLEEGRVERMMLVGGEWLRKGELEITGEARVSGVLSGVEREQNGDGANAVTTAVYVPGSLAGQYMIVNHPDGSSSGFRIESIEHEEGLTRIRLADQEPGFELLGDGASRQLFYPHKQWTGAHTFEIVGSETKIFETGIASPYAGTVTGAVYNSDGQPLANVSVRLSGFLELAAVSGAEGGFTLQHVPSGEYRVIAERSDLGQTVSSSVYVAEHGSSLVMVHMPDRSPPVASGAEAGVAGEGDAFAAVSSEDGYLYLVPAKTWPVRPALEAALTVGQTVYGVRIPVEAGVPATIDTSGIVGSSFMLYAVDESDNVSSGKPLQLIPVDLTEVDDMSPYAVYSGLWLQGTDARYIGGTSRTAVGEGAYVDLTFYGSWATLYGLKAGNQGKAAVYIDGIYRETIDNYSPGWQAAQEIYNTGPLAHGAHRIRLVRLDEKHASSTGFNINFDRLEVVPEEEIPPYLSDIDAGVRVTGPTGVGATSSKNGVLYLVPTGTTATEQEIVAAALQAGTSVSVTAGVYAALDTSGLSTGLYRLYAIDLSGNVSAGSPEWTMLAREGGTIDSANPIVIYAGSWSTGNDSRYIGGSARSAIQDGAYAELSFYGSAVRLLGVRSANQGKADIYVDDIYVTTVDNYSAAWGAQQTLFEISGLAEGVHTIRYERTGERNPASSNTIVNLDAAIVW